nr:histone-lysine N-methyltransferase, H3 lysine-36 specific-like isoform X2 [Symphalangus syndactylus]
MVENRYTADTSILVMLLCCLATLNTLLSHYINAVRSEKKCLRKPSKWLLEYTEEYDQIFTPKKKQEKVQEQVHKVFYESKHQRKPTKKLLESNDVDPGFIMPKKGDLGLSKKCL